MATLFSFLSIASLVALVIGVRNPDRLTRFIGRLLTKKQVLAIFGSSFVLSSLLVSVFSAPPNTVTPAPSQPTTQAEPVTPKPEEVAAPQEISTAETPSEPATAVILYSVTKVVDGDTITVNQNGTPETVRLIGVDTPETVDPRKPVQCFGKEASAFTTSLLTGRSVRLEPDPTQYTRDKYGRLLAFVYRDDGLFVNQHLIAEGYAHEYTYQVPYRYQSEFKTAEALAKQEQKGLWAPDACPTPSAPPPSQPPPSSPAPVPSAPSPSTSTSTYICDRNAYNCTDFKTQREAQDAFEACGGPATDIHRLDSDKDGKVCESLP